MLGAYDWEVVEAARDVLAIGAAWVRNFASGARRHHRPAGWAGVGGLTDAQKFSKIYISSHFEKHNSHYRTLLPSSARLDC
jgi:hypothetical protein